MQNPNASLFGKNIFADAFQEFDEDSFFQSLHNRVRNKSYFQKYKGFKDTLLAASYLFNAASMLTASYAVYWLTEWVTGMVWVAYLVAVIFLFFLEKLKRKSSSEFFQVWFFRKEIATGWLGLSLFCFGISIASSSFGTRTGAENLAPDPELLAADSTATAYRAEVKKLETENAELSNQRDHTGTIYYRLQAVIKQNKAMIADYNSRILKLDEQLAGKNEQLSGEYQKQVEVTAWTLVWITVIMELLFEACIAYIWYYYYRSYVERKKTKGFAEDETPSPEENIQPLPYPADEQLNLIMAELKQIKTHLPKQAHSENGTQNDIPFSQNGTPKSFSSNRPIGFYTDSQLSQMGYDLTEKENSSVQICTDLYKETVTEFGDKYTIPHTYKRGGKEKTVHYTLAQVEARISQYERHLEDALRRNLEESVIENRQGWVEYWKGKRMELLEKIRIVKS